MKEFNSGKDIKANSVILEFRVLCIFLYFSFPWSSRRYQIFSQFVKPTIQGLAQKLICLSVTQPALYLCFQWRVDCTDSVWGRWCLALSDILGRILYVKAYSVGDEVKMHDLIPSLFNSMFE